MALCDLSLDGAGLREQRAGANGPTKYGLARGRYSARRDCGVRAAHDRARGGDRGAGGAGLAGSSRCGRVWLVVKAG
jgi:hypothetical protein